MTSFKVFITPFPDTFLLVYNDRIPRVLFIYLLFFTGTVQANYNEEMSENVSYILQVSIITFSLFTPPFLMPYI